MSTILPHNTWCSCSANLRCRSKTCCTRLSSTCPHNMVNFGPLAAEIGSVVWGSPANVNGFRVARPTNPPILGRWLVAKRLYASFRIPLGTEVGLVPGDCVQWGPISPEKRGRAPHPIFALCLLWPNGWVDKDATWYGSRPQPRPHFVRRADPAPPRKGHNTPPPSSAHDCCVHGRPY